jgi:hypothetical protein
VAGRAVATAGGLLANARAKGVRLGAPRTGDKMVNRIGAGEGEGTVHAAAIAAKLGVGTGSVHRVLNGEHISQAAPHRA